MDRHLPVNPGDIWAIVPEKSMRFFAAEGEPRTLASMGMQARHASTETPQTGTAIISVIGPIAKDSWVGMFGGTSSLVVQSQVQAARADASVDSLFLLIDSPGGEVAGLEELVDEVFAAAGEMPVHAHIDDLGASAAYWIASQAGSVSANSSALVGSIGAIAQVADISAMLAEAGIKIHTIRSGDKKAVMAGPEVTDEALSLMQELIDGTAGRFLDAVERGRGISAAVRADVADARIMTAGEAMSLGLIDSISSRQAALDSFRSGLNQKARTSGRAQAMAARHDALRTRMGRRPVR